ncbi:hypothetical protein [Streptosporangium sandarakinum]|uniref:Uncharacterized protein n=1 Tax=Streptosporangium sandarakinum TaxID=1260955 RepID=A0A852V0W0_9ACTN|nr:hypothetical protein [Streptosporangium sandarakinum]NYF40904.1 hypothetical protein [Streptosporangium sandarakinum]
MGLGAAQWILLGAGCLNVALGVHSLVTGRLPRLLFRRHAGLDPRCYGRGQLLMSVFPFALGPSMGLVEMSYELSVAVILVGLGVFLVGTWLTWPGDRIP